MVAGREPVDLIVNATRPASHTWSEPTEPESFNRRPDWQTRAACHGYPTSWWFPGRGAQLATTVEALKICAGCPVRQECGDYSMTVTPRPEGIWGGISEKRRRQRRRKAA